MYADWVRRGLKKPGKTGKGLAVALGVDPSVVSRKLSGEIQIFASELPTIAQYLGEPPPQIVGAAPAIPAEARAETVQVQTVPVRYVAESGVWREGDGLRPPGESVVIPVIPDPRLEGLEQWGVRIDGAATDKELRPRDYPVFVDFNALRREPQDDDLVLVHRQRGELVEITVRRVRITNGVIQLCTESEDGHIDRITYPFVHRKERLRIVGLHIGTYRPGQF